MCRYFYKKYPPPQPDGKMVKYVKCKIVKSICNLHFAICILTLLLFVLNGYSENHPTKGSSTSSPLSGICNSATPAFIENKGQIIDQNFKPNPACLFLLNTPGMNVQLRKTGFSYDLYSVNLQLEGNRQQAIGN